MSHQDKKEAAVPALCGSVCTGATDTVTHR
jgi:hypothetical protein